MGTLHWHSGTGITGYGPEGEGTDTAMSLTGLACNLRTHLDGIADSERDSAESLAEAGEFEDAWNTLKVSEAADVLGRNLDNRRASAPLYADDAPLWHATINRMVCENFPFDFRDGNSRLYAWDCTEAECLTDDEAVI